MYDRSPSLLLEPCEAGASNRLEAALEFANLQCEIINGVLTSSGMLCRLN